MNDPINGIMSGVQFVIFGAGMCMWIYYYLARRMRRKSEKKKPDTTRDLPLVSE